MIFSNTGLPICRITPMRRSSPVLARSSGRAFFFTPEVSRV